MNIRKISAIVPAALLAATVLAAQTPAFADYVDGSSGLAVEQASVPTTNTDSVPNIDAQGTNDPFANSGVE